MIYTVLIILCVFFIFLENSKGCEKLLPYLQLGTVVFLILFVGLRYRTGPDYDSYEISYLGRSDFRFESMFNFFMIVFRKLGATYHVFLLFIAALSISIKSYVLNRQSPYFFLSLLVAVGFFLSDMGQIRYALAISVLWLSIPFYLEKRLIAYLLVVLCAVLIHQTAIVFLPVYWLCSLKLNFPLMLFIWAACYLASYTALGDSVMDLFSDYSFSDTATTKMDVYSENESLNTRYVVSLSGLVAKTGILALVYYSPIGDESLKRFYINIGFIGGCFMFFFSFSEILSSRLSAYFLSFDALMIPAAMIMIKDSWLYYSLLLVLIAKYVYQFIFQVYFNYPEMYLDYRNVLFN